MLKLPSLGEMDRTLGVRVYLAAGSTEPTASSSTAAGRRLMVSVRR